MLSSCKAKKVERVKERVEEELAPKWPPIITAATHTARQGQQ